MDDTIWTGGCECGAVRYRGVGTPLRMLNCHCRDCQRASGSGFAAIVTLRVDAVAFDGELRWHEKTASSGHAIARGFCPMCGSPVAVRPSRAPHVIGLQAGGLDDPAMHQPTAEIYTDRAQPWVPLAPDTTKFPRGWRHPE